MGFNFEAWSANSVAEIRARFAWVGLGTGTSSNLAVPFFGSFVKQRWRESTSLSESLQIWPNRSLRVSPDRECSDPSTWLELAWADGRSIVYTLRRSSTFAFAAKADHYFVDLGPLPDLVKLLRETIGTKTRFAPAQSKWLDTGDYHWNDPVWHTTSAW